MEGDGAGGGGGGAGDCQQVKAVATTGGATRDRGGSGSGGPRRAQAARFLPRPPSYVNRRRRSSAGARIFRFLELVDAAASAGQDGAAAGAGSSSPWATSA